MNEMDFRQLESLAAAGDMDAQFRLAVAYTYGDGVKDDNDKAFELYTLAAKQGHAEAVQPGRMLSLRLRRKT